MRDPRTTAQVAASAVIGGAAAIRVQGLADVQFTRAAVEVPVIGLWKDGHDGVFITPTLRHALAVANAGAHVVAIDGTRRAAPRRADPGPDGRRASTPNPTPWSWPTAAPSRTPPPPSRPAPT